MIEIHLGVIDAQARAGVEVIREPQDYISARLAIREALRVGGDLHIYVQSRMCDEWFWDLTDCPGVKITREDPILLLCQKLHVPALPPEIADPIVITSLKLIDLPNPSDTVRDVGDWVAEHILGQVWTVAHPSYEHVTDLLSWLISHAVPEVLQPLVERKMRSWMSKSSGQLREAYQAVNRDLATSAQFLCCLKVLKGYDEKTREDWLREIGWYLPNLQWLADKLGDLPLPVHADTLLSPKVEAYWRRRLVELNQGLDR